MRDSLALAMIRRASSHVEAAAMVSIEIAARNELDLAVLEVSEEKQRALLIEEWEVENPSVPIIQTGAFNLLMIRRKTVVEEAGVEEKAAANEAVSEKATFEEAAIKEQLAADEAKAAVPPSASHKTPPTSGKELSHRMAGVHIQKASQSQ